MEFVTYMLSECFKKYELHSHKFSALSPDDEDTETYIQMNIDQSRLNYYWTLYIRENQISVAALDLKYSKNELAYI